MCSFAYKAFIVSVATQPWTRADELIAAAALPLLFAAAIAWTVHRSSDAWHTTLEIREYADDPFLQVHAT